MSQGSINICKCPHCVKSTVPYMTILFAKLAVFPIYRKYVTVSRIPVLIYFLVCWPMTAVR